MMLEELHYGVRAGDCSCREKNDGVLVCQQYKNLNQQYLREGPCSQSSAYPGTWVV